MIHIVALNIQDSAPALIHNHHSYHEYQPNSLQTWAKALWTQRGVKSKLDTSVILPSLR